MIRRLRAGFMSIEILVAMAIIGVLIALLPPSVQAVREAARRPQCTSNLKQIGVAVPDDHDAFGAFPFSKGGDYMAVVPGAPVHARWSAHSQLLYFTEQTPISEQGRTMLEDVVTLTKDATRVSPADHERLRTAGFDDRAILQITLIAAWCHYIDRVADALGVGRE